MHNMTMDTSQLEAYEKIVLEMRRGILIMAVLSQLQSEKYGYALITDLEAHGLPIDQGTLYPLLRRLASAVRQRGDLPPLDHLTNRQY